MFRVEWRNSTPRYQSEENIRHFIPPGGIQKLSHAFDSRTLASFLYFVYFLIIIFVCYIYVHEIEPRYSAGEPVLLNKIKKRFYIFTLNPFNYLTFHMGCNVNSHLYRSKYILIK